MLFTSDSNEYFIDEECVTETTMLFPQPFRILLVKLETSASHQFVTHTNATLCQ
jgi:hypothetical protein